MAKMPHDMKSILGVFVILFFLCPVVWATWHWSPAEYADEKLFIMQEDGLVDPAKAGPEDFEKLMARLQKSTEDIRINDQNDTPDRFAQEGWRAYERKEYKKVEALALRCWQRYRDEALRIQAELEETGPYRDYGDKKDAALDRLGECLFMLGQMYHFQERYSEAAVVFREIIARYDRSAPLSK